MVGLAESHTVSDILIREVPAVLGARRPHAPKSAPGEAISQTLKIDLSSQGAVLKSLFPVFVVDFVPVLCAKVDSQIYMSICGRMS